jgi:hypothetical protein
MNEQEQCETLRLLLGALYSKCGFTQFWKRKHGNKYPSRYEVLLASAPELEKYGISLEDLRYLVGPWSPYWPIGNPYKAEFPKSLHQVAEILKSMFQKPGQEERARIFLSVWRFVTLHDSYEISECLDSQRLFLTEDGVSDVDIYGDVDVKRFYEEFKEELGHGPLQENIIEEP